MTHYAPALFQFQFSSGQICEDGQGITIATELIFTPGYSLTELVHLVYKSNAGGMPAVES